MTEEERTELDYLLDLERDVIEIGDAQAAILALVRWRINHLRSPVADWPIDLDAEVRRLIGMSESTRAPITVTGPRWLEWARYRILQARASLAIWVAEVLDRR